MDDLFNDWDELENELDFVSYALRDYDTAARAIRCNNTIVSREPQKPISVERYAELRRFADMLQQRIKEELKRRGIDISKYD